ncbi:NADP-dependent oxidoreductase [Actinomadura litoris]|uniref:NADP-dependent oxidoreductase n=1 Tax=Actinomadura litoris TaxID=2678616 RepID=UPI001FA7DFEF|nr:NADP-dependent oxidoreductase [Actinomadura litoris]
MRAIAVPEYGATPVPANVPRPEPGPGQLLVKVIAAGVNTLDWRIAEGALKDSVDAAFPLVLGRDGAGVVEDVGEGVTRLRHGEQVYGCLSDVARGLGTYAEYAVVDQHGPVGRIPDRLLYSDAAAVPTACMTALELVEAAGVTAGQAVLVAGATTGVGRAVVQLAAASGATVVATARRAMVQEIRELGAAATVDPAARVFTDQVLAAHPGGLDTVIDLVSDAAGAEALVRLLRPGGTYAGTTWAVNPDAMAARRIRGVNLDGTPTAALLERVSALVDSGGLRVAVEREVPLDAAPGALADDRAGPARHGATVIRI